jgi:HD-GYP domain-containing protein (c-di-GMP phosphodiesterase class II)
MVRYNLDDITDDMILGESLFLPTGELLLAAGYRLRERYRRRLLELGFTSVLVEVEGTESVIPETIISTHVQREMALSLDKTTKDISDTLNVFDRGERSVQKMIRENRHHLNKFIATSGLFHALDKFIEDILSQSSVVLNMSELSKASGDLFTHAINVTIVALCIGKKYHFTYEEMKQLGIGAINVDLGMVAVPRDILEKTGALTDEENLMLRQHTVFGYLMLSQNPAIPPTSAAVALQHHEHQDGAGYPRGIKGENRPPLKDFSRKKVIHRFAEIVAVADTYEMLTSGRLHYSEPHCTQDAIKSIIEMGGHRLNSEVVKTLVAIVPIFPTGARVRIVNAPVPQLVGYIGVVAKNDPESLDQPSLVLYETRNHQKVKPILIDTAKHSGIQFELVT